MEARVTRAETIGKRLALVSAGIGLLLALTKILVGFAANSTALVSDGFEGAADVASSAIVFLGLHLASRPPDQNHPYGHGRFETLSGLAVGALLFLTGFLIFWRSSVTMDSGHLVRSFALYPIFLSMAIKIGLSGWKFRVGRRIGSASLQADAWHDITDLISTTVALIAIGLTLLDPARFHGADHFGGMLIGLIVIFLSVRVVRQTVEFLTDTMPDDDLMRQIRTVAATVPGALAIEKCWARRTGLKYHVDMHLEVDPGLTVRESHSIATQVRIAIKENLDWVADVLVHVEPSLGNPIPETAQPLNPVDKGN
jgi:cation diffusion facilitator family transporter